MEKQLKNSIIKEVKREGSITAACDKLSVHRTQYYREIKKDPVFQAEIKTARAMHLLKS